MLNSAPLRLPQQPSKPIKLPPSTASSVSTTVLPSLTQPSNNTSNQLTPSLVTRTCSVCCLHPARYTCPRCNVSTCSLDCYRQHSGRCVQQFASTEEKQAMTGTMVDEDTRRDTLAMLQRVHQQQQAEEVDTSVDDEEVGRLEGEEEEELARLVAAVGDDTLSLSSLSAEQQRQFLRAAHDGSLSRHIPIAVPWWVSKRGRQHSEGQGQEHETQEWEPEMERTLVQELEQVQSEETQQTTAFVRSLPPLSSIFSTEPSPVLPYHVLELVYGYCYLYRLYNCEPDTDLPAFLADLITLSSSLTPTATSASHYQSTATTLQQCAAHTRSLPSLFQSPQFSTLVLRDCSHICLNTILLLRLLHEVGVWCDSGGTGGGSGMRRVGKKVWFWCVWLQDRGADVMRRVGEEARVMWKAEQALCDRVMQ